MKVILSLVLTVLLVAGCQTTDEGSGLSAQSASGFQQSEQDYERLLAATDSAWEQAGIKLRLATAKFFLGKTEEAERLTWEAVEYYEKLGVAKYPHLAVALFFNSNANAKLGAYDKAVLRMEHSLDIMQAEFGEAHPCLEMILEPLEHMLKVAGPESRASEVAALRARSSGECHDPPKIY